MAFDKKLLEILACPVCKGKLQYVEDKSELVCRFDRLAYPIREHLPVLLQVEARDMPSEELESLGK
jgi:uncharacterized protein YbaR (Trm112 family)